MKYPEGMEEVITVRPGILLVEPGSKGKAFPKGGPLLLVRERGEVCFSLRLEVNG
jgi:hypothetical protein